MPDFPIRPQRKIGGELVIPVMAVAFTIYFFTTIWNSPWTAQVNAFIIGGFLLLVCGIFFIRAAILLMRGDASLSFGTLANREDVSTGRLWLLFTTAGYCVLIDYGGFTLTTFVFLALSMAILGRGRRLGLILGLSAVMALGGWALFVWAFDTRFPHGPFEALMDKVV